MRRYFCSCKINAVNIKGIIYKIKTSRQEDILSHLKKCDEIYIKQLEERVDLEKYSKKLFDKSVTFEAWTGNVLAGLIAAYFNDEVSRIGYISNVSVIKDFLGKRISTELMESAIKYAGENNFKEIRLEVNKNNIPAINLYRKFGFAEYGYSGDYINMKLSINCNNSL